MSVERVRFQELDETALKRWSELRDEQVFYTSPFYDWKFTQIVSEVRDDVWVIVVRDGDHISLFWPVQKIGNVAHPVGAPFSDYHGPLMDAAWTGDLADVIEKAGFAALKFHGLNDRRNVAWDSTTNFDGAYIADISGGAEDFFAQQKAAWPRHAKKMRRISRKVDREVGELTFRFEDTNEDLADELLEWKRKQYRDTGRHDVLGPSWTREMLMRLWKEGVPGCRGIFQSLRHGDRLIAGEFNLACRRTIHGWIPAYDPEFSSYSPGYLIQDRIVQTASELGYQFYDLGVSAGHYKKYYATYQIPVSAGTIRARSPLHSLSSICATAWRELEHANLPKVSAIAGQVRRRYAMIETVETSLKGRLSGLAFAARQITRPPLADSPAADSQD